MVGVLLSTARKLALKIASYGVMHLVVAILVAFALTRDWRVALAVGMVEPFFQTIAYSIHDRVWHRIERRRRAKVVTPQYGQIIFAIMRDLEDGFVREHRRKEAARIVET